MESLLFAALGVEFDKVAGNVLDFGLSAVFQLFPGTRTQLIQTRSLALLPFVLGNLVQGVNGDKDNVFILIDQFHHFLRRVAIRNTHQSGETSHTVVGMYHIIARRELIELFQTQGDLSAASFIALQVVLVETVEQLMVGKDAETQSVIGKSLVQGTLYGGKGDVVSTVVEDSPDAVGLLLAVATYIQVVSE